MVKSGGNALISVFNKSGIAEFAKNLNELGWNIYASGGTAKAIKAAGVNVKDTSELTKGGEILGHRVVTLSREIYAGILADNSKEHVAELKKLNIPRIDLVCVDMYPLKDEINKKGSSEQSILEQTDIGGPTLLRAAAKGRRIVLARSEQRSEVIKWLKDGMPEERAFKRRLAAVAEYEVADYVIQSANYLGEGVIAGLIGERIDQPPYGENPWQKGAGLFVARHVADPLGISKFKLVQGVGLSYNNYTDVDRMLQSITHVAAAFERNYGAVPSIALGAKHGNLCGAGVDKNNVKAIKKMLDGDQRAIFGGSVIVNFDITKKEAETIMHYKMEKGKRILDIIIAPNVSDEALEIMKRKNGKLRIFVNPALASLGEKLMDRTGRVRHVRGGRLRQDNYTFIFDYSDPAVEWSGPKVPVSQAKDMLIAWAIGSTSNSNTISIVKDGQLLSNGVGQQDRVSAAELALMRAKNAKHNLVGASAFSDSFFPFPDGPKLLAGAGITGILTTRGSVRDDEVKELLEKSGVSLCTLPDSMARAFFAH